MAEATRTIHINAPVERCFEVITNYEHYPEFLLAVKRVRTFDRSGPNVSVEYDADIIKRITYSVRMFEEAPHRVSWTFIRGDFMKNNYGGWVLEPDGAGTKATYTVAVDLGPLVPKALLRPLVEVQLPTLLTSFKRRIEQKT